MDLPPPPLHPELPPEVRITGEDELFFRTDDGVAIEALANLPDAVGRVAVLCHPHPLYGGTMHNAIMVVVAKRLLERGQGQVGWLRLNYRGVGKSEGAYGAGKTEALDARAAFAEAAPTPFRPHLSLLYGRLEPLKRAAVLRELAGTLELTFEASELHVFRTLGPSRDWRPRGAFPLGG